MLCSGYGHGSREKRVLLSAPSAGPSRRQWASVLGLSLGQLVAWGALYYSYNVLSAPIAADFGLSRRFVAGAFSLTLLLSGLLARPVGRLLDRRGARPVLLVGAVLGPLALASLALVRSEAALVLAFAALGISHSLALYEPAFRAIVDRFPKQRDCSRALLVLTSVGGFASTAFLPLTAWLLTQLGWRRTVIALAVMVAAVALPVGLSLSSSARAITANTDRSTSAAGSSALANALGIGFALQSFASTGTTICLVWHLVERGETMGTAAMIAGVAGGSQVIGRLLLGPIQRAVRTELRLPLLFLVQASALAGVAVGSGLFLMAAVILFGAAGGTMTLERATVTLEWFGRDDFGARSGHIASIAFLARAASPYGVELLHGTTSYAGAYGVLAVGLVGGALVMMLASRARASTLAIAAN